MAIITNDGETAAARTCDGLLPRTGRIVFDLRALDRVTIRLAGRWLAAGLFVVIAFARRCRSRTRLLVCYARIAL
jgi:hypothetical protein